MVNENMEKGLRRKFDQREARTEGSIEYTLSKTSDLDGAGAKQQGIRESDVAKEDNHGL